MDCATKDEPWKAPNHYPPAPIKLVGQSATTKKLLTIRKQPIARSGFRRGNRMVNSTNRTNHILK